MIFKPLTFTIICFALSSFDLSHSLAAQPNSSSFNPKAKKTFFADGVASNGKEAELQLVTLDNPVAQPLTSIDPRSTPEEIAISSQNDLEEPEISRRWSMGAMGITFMIALLLLWILFRPPIQKSVVKAELVESNPLEQNEPQAKTQSLAESQNVAAPDQENLLEGNVNSQSLLDSASNPPEETNQTASSIANIDLTQELIHDLQPVPEVNSKVSADLAVSSHTATRRKAIWKLTDTGDYRSIEPLLKIMPQVGAADRSLILDAVTQIASRSFQPINDELFVALQHQDPEVRLNGIRDFKRLYQFTAPVITKIAQMQSDPDYEVRQTAAQALHQLNSSPLPTFGNYSEQEIDSLVSGKDSETNLHLVAYLLAELDTKS